MDKETLYYRLDEDDSLTDSEKREIYFALEDECNCKYYERFKFQ